MLADPQSVTINGVATSLPRISSATNQAVYQSADGLVKMSIQHTYQPKKNRRVVRIDQKKISSDPLVTANNLEYKQSVYIVFESPTTVGFTVAEQVYLSNAILGALTASSSAMTTAVAGGQS